MEKISSGVGTADDPESYWDPVAPGSVKDKVKECEESNRHMIEQFEFDKLYAERNRYVIGLFALVITLMWAVSYRSFLRGDLSSSTVSYAVLALGVMVVAAYYLYVREHEKSLLELAVAEEYGWLYDSGESNIKWAELVVEYPEIFRKGNIDRKIGNQFWGVFEGNPFWSARFIYAQSHGNDDERSYHVETVYAFRLPRVAAHDFVLVPQNIWLEREARTGNGLTTESNEFNRLFHIDYAGDTGSVGADILQVLSPDAQEKLIAFRRNAGPFSMIFRGDRMVVDFACESLMRHTDFFRSVAIDPKDKEAIAGRMESVIGLAHAVLPCIE